MRCASGHLLRTVEPAEIRRRRLRPLAVSRVGEVVEGRGLTATATETTIMAPEIAAGGLGMFLCWYCSKMAIVREKNRRKRRRGVEISGRLQERRRRQESATRSARVQFSCGGIVADLSQQQLA